MNGASGFRGGGAASEAAAEDYVGLSVAAVRAEDEEGRGGEEEDLELGLSLGARKAATDGGGGRTAAWGDYCRILTAKDFPSLGSRVSPRSSTSSVSSSSATLGGGGAGTKRAAESVASDAGGSTSPPSPVVVGWPPIRAFRINTLVNQCRDNYSDSDTATHEKSDRINGSKNEGVGRKDHKSKGGHVVISRFVKVNMDGDPIGRKVDLNAHHSYETLALALEIMFHKPTMILSTASHGAKASKLLDGSSEFALTYEDRDGDWMLVGDVPWGMFLDTVKRLRIMRTSEASGLEPRFQPSKSAGLMRNKPA